MKHNVRRIGGAVAVAVAAMAAPAITAAPANAVSQTLIHPEIVDGCEGCPGPLFTVDVVVIREKVPAVTRSVASGLSGLIAAKRATDPAVSRRLHDTAIKTLAGGAATAGNATWGWDDPNGDLCPRRPWPFPGPRPQWDQLESQLSQGMTLLGQANRTGDGALVSRAAGLLDAGAAGLTEFQGCV
ncbi:MAG TPA: hypothetical protein VLM05_20655 [Mycobacteriales bacterium]|nr:hypothetical protein [Mycobacteriales bacterium]